MCSCISKPSPFHTPDPDVLCNGLPCQCCCVDIRLLWSSADPMTSAVLPPPPPHSQHTPQHLRKRTELCSPAPLLEFEPVYSIGDPVSPNQPETLAQISGFLMVVVKKTIC